MKYDIDSKYNPNIRISLNDLCKEIYKKENNYLSENDCLQDIPEYLVKDIYNKFHNKDNEIGSGIIDVLKHRLGVKIDINIIKKECDKKYFKVLQMLNVFYHYEHINKENSKNGIRKPRLINLLEKPRQYNIDNNVGYGIYFGEVYDSLKKLVPDYELRIKKIEDYGICWNYYIYKIFDYVWSDGALEEYKNNPQEVITQLKNIRDRLKQLESNVSSESAKMVKPTEDVIPYVFNVFACHKIMAESHDKAYLSDILNDIHNMPCKEYCELFKSYEAQYVSWEKIGNLRKLIETIPVSNNADKDFLKLIGYKHGGAEKKDYIYAFNHITTVAKWLETDKKIDMSQGLTLGILVVIIQEIITNKHLDDIIENDYVGYKNKGKTLMSALKHPNNADKIILDAWIKRLEDRVAINFGVAEAVKIKREIDKSLYNLMGVAFSYKNIDDIDFANKLLFGCVANRCMGERYYGYVVNDIFAHMDKNKPAGAHVTISSTLRGVIKKLTISVSDTDKQAMIREQFVKEICKDIQREAEKCSIGQKIKKIIIEVNSIKIFLAIRYIKGVSFEVDILDGGIIESDQYVDNAKRLHLDWFIME